ISSASTTLQSDKRELNESRRIAVQTFWALWFKYFSEKNSRTLRRKRKRRSLERRSSLLHEARRRSGHRLDARVEARHTARCGVGSDDAGGGATLDLGLGRAEGGDGRLLVAGGDRLLDLLDRAAHAAAAGGICGGALHRLAGALLGRL